MKYLKKFKTLDDAMSWYESLGEDNNIPCMFITDDGIIRFLGEEGNASSFNLVECTMHIYGNTDNGEFILNPFSRGDNTLIILSGGGE